MPPALKLSRLSRQLAEVLGVAWCPPRLFKVLDREDTLTNLQDKSETLMDGALAFRRGTKKMAWNMQWQNMCAIAILDFAGLCCGAW